MDEKIITAKKRFLKEAQVDYKYVFTFNTGDTARRNKLVADMLRKRLKMLDIKQQAVAEALGLSHGSLNRMLNGYDPMSMEISEKIETIINLIESGGQR